jgi:hypothetical protein
MPVMACAVELPLTLNLGMMVAFMSFFMFSTDCEMA